MRYDWLYSRVIAPNMLALDRDPALAKMYLNPAPFLVSAGVISASALASLTQHLNLNLFSGRSGCGWRRATVGGQAGDCVLRRWTNLVVRPRLG